jgi:hypothetical protein
MTGGRRELVAVFESHAQAEEAVRRLRAAGLPEHEIHLDGREDEATALRGTMRDELERSWLSPQAGLVLTKRMTKGILTVSPLFVAIGVVLALPLAFLAFDGMALWTRLLTVVVLGALAGGTVGFIVGAGEAEKGKPDPLEPERGTVLRVGADSDDARRLLTEADPIRLDVVATDGSPLGPVVSEEEDESVVENLERAWREPDRDPDNRHEDLSRRRSR